MMHFILLLCTVTLSAARPDVSHIINGPSFDYGVPLVGAPNNINEVTSTKYFTSASQNLLARLSKEDHTGYDYPKPTVPFDLPAPSSVSIVQTNLDNNRQYLPPVAENRVSTTTVLPPSTAASYLPPRVAAASTNRPLVATRDYLPPLRPAASAVSPRVVNRDYLPPVTTERRVSTTTYVPPVTSETRVSSTAYLPPSTAETRISTTAFSLPTRPAVIYNRGSTPAANSPIPATVAAEETTGYDYPRPTVNFDLPSPSPSNDVPVVIPTTSREYLPPVAPSVPVPSPSAPPLILIPSSTTQQTVISSTTTDLPPAPEVILPSHTLDEDGYKYRVPDKPFNF
ncbi:mucin-2-like [Phlebotomus papatasi]|uniref:mucin-2-like n=1 Tax=Phlebotomus papatasi TaxID=29031 RepID=UPI002483620C|nr:mucin-2-like [Phlebotomus papatasi]